MKHIKIYIATIILLFITPIVYANYAVSSTQTLIIEKGSSAQFDFQIQAYASNYDLKCYYDIGNTTPFIITFQNQSLNVAKKTAEVITGIVKVPKKIDEGTYSYEFCISCSPDLKEGGAATNFRYCGLPITINVIQPKKQKMTLTNKIIIITTFIILIALLIALIISIKKYRNKREKTEKNKTYKY